MTSFRAEEWIFVGDMNVCEYSKPQVQVCNELGLKIHGAILCNDDQQKNSEACRQVPAFPAFCNKHTNICVSGLRETQELFDELQSISDEKAGAK